MSTLALDNIGTAPVEIGRARIERPFKQNGDLDTKVVTRTYKQAAGYFVASVRGAPDREFPNCYLIDESDPQPTLTGCETFTRTYANIPPTQTVESSFVLQKPAMSGTFPQAYGPYRLIQQDSTLARYDAYVAATVISDTGAPSFYPTGGTYTLTFDGSTTAASLSYMDSAGAVQTALNFLTPIANRGNVVVTGSYNSAGGFVVTFNPYAQITIATGSLTGGTIAKTESLASGGYLQTVAAAVAVTPLAITADYSNLITTQGTGLGITSSNYYGPTYGVNNGWVFVLSCASGGTYYTGGTYTLTISGHTTGPIAYNATAAEIETALNALGVGSITLQGRAGVSIPAGCCARSRPRPRLSVYRVRGSVG